MKTQPKVATLAATLITFGSLSGGANAAVIANFDFVAASGTTIAPTLVDADYTVSSLSLVNVANTLSASSNHFYFNNWGATLDLTKYYTLTVSSASQFTVDQMTFSMEDTGGNSSWILRSSVDAYTSNIATGLFSGGVVTDFNNVDVSSTGLTNSLEFRWYVTNDSGFIAGFATHLPGGSGGGLSDVGVNFSLSGTAVPEPSSTLLLGLGALGLVARRKRTTKVEQGGAPNPIPAS